MRSRVKVIGLKELIKDIKDITEAKTLHDEMVKWLDKAGGDFLEIVQDQIKEAGNINTGDLLKSFTKKAEGNSYELHEGNITLTIGTRVEYASFVNDGHFQSKRFVPGIFKGGKFVYTPGADTGMMLKAKFVEGSHYFDNAVIIFEKMFYKDLDKKLQIFLDKLGR